GSSKRSGSKAATELAYVALATIRCSFAADVNHRPRNFLGAGCAGLFLVPRSRGSGAPRGATNQSAPFGARVFDEDTTPRSAPLAAIFHLGTVLPGPDGAL